MTSSPPARTPCSAHPTESLLQLAGQGNQPALLALFQEQVPALLRLIRKRLQPARRLESLYEPEDFLQETALRLFDRRLPARVFAASASFVAYVNKIARNCVNAALRKHRTHKGNLHGDIALDHPGVRPDWDLVSHEPQPDGQALVNEEVLVLMDHLDIRQFWILVMVPQGYTLEHIAGGLDFSMKTMHRQVDELRTRISRRAHDVEDPEPHRKTRRLLSEPTMLLAMPGKRIGGAKR